MSDSVIGPLGYTVQYIYQSIYLPLRLNPRGGGAHWDIPCNISINLSIFLYVLIPGGGGGGGHQTGSRKPSVEGG